MLWAILLTLLPAGKTVQAQDVPVDTSGSKETFSVRGAVIRSSIMPGWGQWYNDQKLKSLLVIGVEAGLFGAAAVQRRRAAESDNPLVRDLYLDDSSRFIWYAAGFWLLNVIDAYVDAKLHSFDVSDDLSLGCGYEKGGVIIASMEITF